MEKKQKNVLGEDLEECSNDPVTGWFRDGCCNTDQNDHGVHTVCAKVTDEFLQWCKNDGNDLKIPRCWQGHIRYLVFLNYRSSIILIKKRMSNCFNN